MKKAILYFLILPLNFLMLCGQAPRTSVSHAYILLKTDTIFCCVLNKDLYHSTKIRYTLPGDTKVHKVSILDIVEIYDNLSVYEKVFIDKKIHVLKRLIRGPVSLYEYDMNSEYNMESGYGSGQYLGGATSRSMANSIFYLKKCDKFVQIYEKSCKEDIKSVLKDSPDNKKIDELQSNDVYAFIKAFVNNYNKWLKEEGRTVECGVE